MYYAKMPAFLGRFLGGTLISAIALDENNQMFPLAWAVGEGEKDDSWLWFLINVNIYIKNINKKGLTLVSSQHKV